MSVRDARRCSVHLGAIEREALVGATKTNGAFDPPTVGATLTLTVVDISQFEYPPNNALTPVVGHRFTATPVFTANTGVVSFSPSPPSAGLPPLPDGIKLNPETGVLSGKPTQKRQDQIKPLGVILTVKVDGVECATDRVIGTTTVGKPATCKLGPKRIFIPQTKVRNSRRQMYTNRQHAIAARTKMTSILKWLRSGIRPKSDICNNIAAADLASTVPLAKGAIRPPSGKTGAARPLEDYGYTFPPRAKGLPRTARNFMITDGILRQAERRFKAIRGQLMREVVGADFARGFSLTSDQKLAQNLYVPTTPRGRALGIPPRFRGPDPVRFCTEHLAGRPRPRPLKQRSIRCQQERAVRMIHLANVMREALIHHIRSAPRNFTQPQATGGQLNQARKILGKGCPKSPDFASQLCGQTTGKDALPTAEANKKIDTWLDRLYRYENRYLGGSVRLFGVRNRGIGPKRVTISPR